MPNTQATAPGTRDHEGQSLSPSSRGAGSEVGVRRRRRQDQGARRVSFQVALARPWGIVGESGCGKSVTSLAIMGCCQGPTVRWWRLHPLSGRSCSICRRSRCTRCGQPYLHDLSGARDGPQPGADGRRSADGGVSPPPSRLQQGFSSAVTPPSPCCRRWGSPSLPSVSRLIPQSFRRHAPVGDDRHGAGLRTGPAHLRRAYHGARCDHPGPDPGSG